MSTPILFRKRYIPNEILCLKDDIITFMDEDKIITKWKTIKPRKDFSYGASCYYLKEGFKVSKVFNSNYNCIYHYCDIVNTFYEKEKNHYIFSDLLIDVVIYENGFVKVLDIAEIAEALDKKLISIEEAKFALNTTDKLLNIIYENKFEKYSSFKFEKF